MRLLPAAFAICVVVVMSGCTSVFFYPQKQLVRTPADIQLDYDDVTLTAQDGTHLNAWLLKAKQPRKGIVYFLHGNAENISTHIGSVYWLPEQGYDVLLLDYRGYGKSGGDPSLPEVFDDIETGFRWLQHYNADKHAPVFFLGQSIGATLGVTWLARSPAAQSGLHAVVLDSPFSSYPGMVRDVLQRSWLTWLFAYPVSWGFTSRYDAGTAALSFPPQLPVLFFHSRDDQVVPFARGLAVWQNLSAKNKTEVIANGPHIATFNFPENREALLVFLSSHRVDH